MGNAGTIAGTNFIGTTDNQALVFRTNNIEKLRITPEGNIGGAGYSTTLAGTNNIALGVSAGYGMAGSYNIGLG